MAITLIGVGAQDAQGAADVTGAYPAAYTPSTANSDFAVVLVAGKPVNTGSNPATPSGWTKRGSAEFFTGSRFTRLVIFHKFLATGDAAPTFVIPTDWSSASGGGISAQMAVLRGVHPTNPFDVADAINTAAAATTWTPPSLTTVTALAWCLTAIATSDDNALSLTTANSFTADMSGASYDSNVGGDFSVALAHLEKTTPGAVTMPVWTETVNGPNPWVGVTMALRPASGGTTRRAMVSWAEFEVPDPPAPAPFALPPSLYAPRAPGTLEHLELYSDVLANGGRLIAPVMQWLKITEQVGRLGEHNLTVVLPFDHPVARLWDTPVDDENLRIDQVFRLIRADGTASEHRISETTRQRQGNTRTRTLISRSIFQDMGFRGKVARTTANGKRTTSFQALSLSMADHWTYFIKPALDEAGAPFWQLGTVAHSFPVDMVYDGDTPLSALRKLIDVGRVALPNGVLELDYEGSDTGYLVHIVEQVGAGLSPLRVFAQRDLLDVGFTERSEDQTTRIYPTGQAGEDGQRPGPGGATWNVIGRTIGVGYVDLVLADPNGGEGPIKYDGQFTPSAISIDDPGTVEEETQGPCYIDYRTGGDFAAPIVSTTAATQMVRVATTDTPPPLFETQATEGGGNSVNLGYQRVQIVADLLLTEVVALDHPAMVAKYGVRVGDLKRDDIPGTDNLVPNPILRVWSASSPLPTGWFADTTNGDVVRETSPRYWEHGGQALRAIMPPGAAGVVSPYILLPLRAQGFLSFFLRVTTIQGRIRVGLILSRRITDPDGNPSASLPWKNGGTGLTYVISDSTGQLVGDTVIPDVTNSDMNTAEDLGVAAAWDLTKYPLYGGFAKLFINPGRNETGTCECIVQGAQLTITPAQMPLLEGNGGVRLHKAANAELGLYATPAPTVAVTLVDLALANGLRFPYDPTLRRGRPIEVVAPDLDTSITTRIVGWNRTWPGELEPSVEVSNELADITAFLAMRGRVSRHPTALRPTGTQGLTYEP